MDSSSEKQGHGDAASSGSDRAERVRDIFDRAMEAESGERSALLERLCGGDDELRHEVMALVEGHDRSGNVLDRLDKLGDEVSRARDDRPSEVAADDEMIGRVLSRYRIEERLGGGGMGVVYRAVDTRLDRPVALKFLPRHLDLDEAAKRRFVREAKAASALDHVNIGYIHEIDEADDGRLFIAMAFYEGETLKHKIARGPLPVAEAVDYAAQIADGLSRVHRAGIIHRDIKPANVMVTTDGVAKIVDFGIAKTSSGSLTMEGITLGSFSYMSPEQGRGLTVDHRTDIWSLGVVVYEMLTGELPIGGASPTMLAGVRQDIIEALKQIRPDLPGVVAEVVDRLLKPDPEERYARAQNVFADLRRAQIEMAAGGGAVWSDVDADGGSEDVTDAREAQGKNDTLHAGSSAMRPADRAAESKRSWLSRRRLPRWMQYVGVAAGVFAIVVAAYQYWVSDMGGPIDSIAVLPLGNMTGNPDQGYIADGMTEALITNLGRIEGLRRVISRTSVMQYRETGKTLPEIGRELGVAAIVEGSLRAYGEQVQVDVRLIEAASERRLWEESFTRATGDVLALQNDVARSIAEAVSIQISPAESSRLAGSQKVDPKVYSFYLRGLQVRVSDVLARGEAISSFEQAVGGDSTFAPAHAALAIEYALAGAFGSDRHLVAAAEYHAATAIALDPALSEPYIAIGLLREAGEWDWSEAEEAFLRAIELNPGDAFAIHELAQLQMRMGRFDEALAMEKKALLLDPLSSRYQSGVGEVLLYGGQYDAAIEELEKANELNSNAGAFYLGHAYWHKGDYEMALEWWRKSSTVYADNVGAGRARFLAVEGRRQEALAIVKEWADGWSSGRYDEFVLWITAEVYADLGDYDLAMDWLEEAYDAHLGFLVYLKVAPAFYPLHGEPRFEALLEKMGLV
ncbi:MAG: protein kinase [Rhodothermia bacterium]|nr:protein kinase [Rhodothermia bacterium]